MNPPVVYIEAPVELQRWFSWLGHPDLQAPVVLAAARPGRLGFYPFADFSPELAAIRWAVAKKRAIVAIDVPVRAILPAGEVASDGRFQRVLEGAGARDLADFWDQEIEARAHGANPEELRRAGLALGWALRQAGVSAADALRESCMRRALVEAPDNSVAVVGTFHGAGLLDGEDVQLKLAPTAPVTSLIPYTWALFDLRSGYPAGVRDPALQQRFYEAFVQGVAPRDVLAEALVDVTRELRRQGHTAGVPDSQEALRMALDLASVRGRKEPGRQELMEALRTTLGRGQLGRGAALGRAMERTLVGGRRGKLPPGTPVSGLVTHLETLFEALKLPVRGEPERTLRLDPLRSELDRRRQVTFLQLQVAQIIYADEVPSATTNKTLGSTWTVRWVPGTAATASLAGVHGVDLSMVAAGHLRSRWRRLETEGSLGGASQLQFLWLAAEAGVLGTGELTLSYLWSPDFVGAAGLAELVGALDLFGKIGGGLCVGTAAASMDGVDPEPLYRAAIRQVEALGGTTEVEPILAMAELVRTLRHRPIFPTLQRALFRLSREGSPLVQGAAHVLGAQTEDEVEALGTWMTSVVVGATTPTSRSALRARLQGALVVDTKLTSDPGVVEPLLDWVDSSLQRDFLVRLPALRGGFEVLSPATRQRFLDTLRLRYGDFEDTTAIDPEVLGGYAIADQRAADGLPKDLLRLSAIDGEWASRPAHGVDRWRLILGREREKLTGVGAQAARSLDELYGRGRGEGSREEGHGDLSKGQLGVREWSGDLEALFGLHVRDEVLALAGERGRPGALTGLDPETVRASVELLRQLLCLAGSLGEGRLEGVRRLIQRVVDDLLKVLALQVRPALRGAALPRPTSRRTAQLDLRRTVRQNLARIRHTPEGPMLVPERLVFRSGSRRELDWELYLLVDVSGSMEASVLYSAMMAAILSGVPWLSVQFYAFNTEVIDLTEHVEDPLSLLLEVSVGGGTDIGRALRYTAKQLRVPSRSLIVVVSDFHEGASVHRLLAEVRGLVDSGAHLLGVAALNDTGEAVYHAGIAAQVASAGVPVAAVSPLELACWVGEVIGG